MNDISRVFSQKRRACNKTHFVFGGHERRTHPRTKRYFCTGSGVGGHSLFDDRFCEKSGEESIALDVLDFGFREEHRGRRHRKGWERILFLRGVPERRTWADLWQVFVPGKKRKRHCIGLVRFLVLVQIECGMRRRTLNVRIALLLYPSRTIPSHLSMFFIGPHPTLPTSTPPYLFSVFCFSASTFLSITLRPFLLLTPSTYRLATFSRSASSPKSSNWSSVNGTQKGSSSSISKPANLNCGLALPLLLFLISSEKPNDSATGMCAVIVNV